MVFPNKQHGFVVRIILAVAVLALVGIGIYVRSLHEESSGPLSYFHEGDTLPGDLKLRTMEGKDVTLADYKGKVILINFWAGWCGPCLHEMPSIAALAKKLEPRGFVVLAPVMDEIPQQGINVLKRVMPEIPFAIFSGLRSQISERFELDALPHSVLLDKNLTVQFSRAGEVNWSQSQVVKLIEGML